MLFRVKQIEKVSKNWQGNFENNFLSDFDIAFNTENGSGILKTSSKIVHCPKCQRVLDYEISQKISKTTTNSVPKRVDFNDFSNKNQNDFFEIVENLVKTNRLKISTCCLLIDSEKRFYGNEIVSFTLSSNTKKLKISNRKKICSLIDITSEKLKSKNTVTKNKIKKIIQELCECPEGENCATFEGTSAFNDFGKTTSGLDIGINLVTFDLDHDFEDLVGFQTFCNDFLVFLKQHGQNHFWVMFSIPVKENNDRYYHTVVSQVLLTKQPHALIIDPSEAQNCKAQMHGYWLLQKTGRKTIKTKITETLKQFLLVKNCTFGSNGNGKAKPEECFAQYPNSCNVTSIVSLFWIAIGYTHVPRFDQWTERGIFCRLRRLKGPLPKNLSTPVNRSNLKLLVKTFISEQ